MSHRAPSHPTRRVRQPERRPPAAPPPTRRPARPGPRRRPNRWRWLGLLALLGFAAGAGIWSAGGGGAFDLRAFGLPVLSHTEATPVAAARPDTAAAQLPAANPFGRNEVNLLVVGTDLDQEVGRTDTVLLLAIDVATRRLGIVSVPRDTRVELPGHGWDRINAAYALGGARLAAQAVADLCGVPVHHSLRVDLTGFETLVDALGGVDLTVDRPMHYVDRAQELVIDLEPGPQRLDGNQAMQYVRFRHEAQGDLARIRRQQAFLRAVARRLAAPENAPRLPLLMRDVAQHVDTTLQPLQLLYLARLLADVDQATLAAAGLPGQPRTLGGASYFIANREAARRAVAQVRAAMNGQPPAAAVTVYNASDRLGLDRLVCRQLAARGIAAVPGGLVEHQEHETRVYAVDDPSVAGRIAAGLRAPLAEVAAPPAYPATPPADGVRAEPVVVVLGVDYGDDEG